MEDDGVYYPELRKIQKSLEQCWLHVKSYHCVNIYEDNCCLAVVLEYHIIASIGNQLCSVIHISITI